MTDELYAVLYNGDGRPTEISGTWTENGIHVSLARAEDAERKLRAWDAAVLTGELGDADYYDRRVMDYERIAFADCVGPEECLDAAEDADTYRELAAAMRAIEEGDESTSVPA